MSAATVVHARDAPAVEPAWISRQHGSWTADPAASWEWIAAGVADAPEDTRLLLLGTAASPVGLLRLSTRAGMRIARPLGRGLDRTAWCPGSTPEETRTALDAACRLASIWLPWSEPTSQSMGGCATRRHGSYLTVEHQSDWGTYLAARSKSLRKTLRAASNRGTRGPMVEVILLDAGDTARRLVELADVEAHGHRRRGHMLSLNQSKPSFTSRLIARLDSGGHLRTFVATVGPTLGAYLIGVAAGGRYLAYTMAVRDEFRHLSLGHRLFAKGIRAAMENGEVIDLGNGDSDFKRRWATSTHRLDDIFLGQRVPVGVARRVFCAEQKLSRLVDRPLAMLARTRTANPRSAH